MFLDRKLEPITLAAWRLLFADPSYATLRKAQPDEGIEVEAFWLGFASRAESPPKPFGVWTALLRENGWRHEEPTWHATEAEALSRFEQVMASLRPDPAAVPRREAEP